MLSSLVRWLRVPRNAAVLAVGAGASVVLYRLLRRLWKGRSISSNRAVFGPFDYPETRTVKHKDTYWGQEVEDPYRWLEDPDSKDTKEWIEAQTECTNNYFSRMKVEREAFFSKMQAAVSYDKYSVPWKRGPYYFFTKKEGLQNQAVYYKQTSLDAQPEVLLDPNAIREDGTASVLRSWFAEDGTYFAYGISLSGSDWVTIRIRNVETTEDLPDLIDWCKFASVAWTKDGKGFFYSRYPAPTGGAALDAGTEVDLAAGQQVFYHKLRTHAADDQLVFYSPENSKWLYSVEVTDDGLTLLLSVSETCDPVNRLFTFDLSQFDSSNVSTLGPCVKLVDYFSHGFDYITNEGAKFWFKTNMDSPRYRIVSMIFPSPERARTMLPEELELVWKNAVEVVPQDTGVLNGVLCISGDLMLLTYLRDVKEELELCTLNNERRRTIPLPSLGTIGGLSGKKNSDEFFYQFFNFQDPGSTYRAVVTRSDSTFSVQTALFQIMRVPGFDPSEFETIQVFYSSKDGVRVPMFIVQRTKANGESAGPRPCLLYGYGGFNISITPGFSLKNLLFIKHFGGIYCVANIRGGGEYGEEWHQQGTIHNKQNVFDDFVAAAQHLIDWGYTTPSQLAINGGSNGGLLVAACINQHPECFAAAVAQVGVLDMLRFHKFTIGYAWCSDYGCADASKEEFETLLKYSPVHNVRADDFPYPATLLLTADHDDRVVPLHSYKYIATLQSVAGRKPEQREPLLIKIESKAGHGAGKPTTKVLQEAADVAAFIAYHTGARWQD